jgi:hypothetical protein
MQKIKVLRRTCCEQTDRGALAVTSSLNSSGARWTRSFYISLLVTMSHHLQTYAERSAKHKNAAAIQLFDTINRKKSNLCVSVDVTKSEDFLAIIDVVGPYVCLVKARSVYTR